jgi:phosphosulfolactate synthase (CoM biosynthesis protein A)
VDKSDSDRAIRRAFERGFVVLTEPQCHLGFRHRVWCEARHQPYVSLCEDGEHAQVELDLSRGPCQLTEEAWFRLSDTVSGVVTSSTLTHWQVQVPVVDGVRVAALFFETANSCAQKLTFRPPTIDE